MATKNAVKTLVRDLKVGDDVDGLGVIQEIYPYGTSHHSLILITDTGEYCADKLQKLTVIK